MAILAACLALPRLVAAQSVEWIVTRGDVRVVCPLTVGGSFEGRSAAVSGALGRVSTAPSAFTGEIRVDLRTIDTGIDLRNRHMRDNYLEVERAPGFETAILSDLVLADLDPASAMGRTRFTARITVHGVQRPVSGTAEVRTRENTARVEARFPLRLPDHEIPPPRYLGVGVKDEIQILASLVLEAKGDPR